MERTLRFLGRHCAFLRYAIYVSGFLLSGSLVWNYIYTQHNVYQTLMALTGQYSLAYLILVLLITPLRRWFVIVCQYWHLSYGKRLSDWNWLIKLRRSLGLVSTWFAFTHLFIYLWLDLAWYWQEIVWDARNRYFVALGWLGWLILTVLAITSPDIAQRALKRKWRQIHRSIYLLAIIVLCHFMLSEKQGSNEVVPWAICIFILLLHRVWFGVMKSSKNATDNGMLVYRHNKGRGAKYLEQD